MAMILRVIRDSVIAFLATLAILASLFFAYSLSPGIPRAAADPEVGCESIHWGLFGSQRRLICDGPIRPDGSWERARAVITPAHYVPFSCYSGIYYSNCSGGYNVDLTIQSRETYIVFPYNVLPDEPGWLPPGPNQIR